MEKGSLKIEWISPEKLKGYPKNSKIHDAKQIANVANSIKRFGWQQPLVIDDAGVVVIGHCRLLAAKKLGLKTVPVTVASGLTDDEIRELRIADNKTNESPWDFELLQEDLEGLDFDGFDFDFEIPEETAESSESDEAKGKLSDMYLVPPFSVIYANKPDWLARKRAWVDRGLRSELGRGGELAYHTRSDPEANFVRRPGKAVAQ